VRVARAGQYAIQALVDLTDRGSGTVNEIAERVGVPEPFLHQLVAPLKDAGLIRAKRGRGGGLELARPPEEVTMLAILNAVGIHDERGESLWTRVLPYPYRARFEGIERLVPDELAMLTLADVRSGDSAGNPMSANPLLMEELPPRRLLDVIGRQAAAVTGADRCAVYFGGSENFGYVTTALEARAGVSLTLPESDAQLTASWIPYRPLGAVAVAWMTGRQVAIEDTLRDKRASPMIAERFRVRSVMATPIHAGRHGFGVLVLSKGEPYAWQEEDLQRASELATIAGFAIMGYSGLGEDGMPPPMAADNTTPGGRHLTTATD
jgi:Rrf2 family protein